MNAAAHVQHWEKVLRKKQQRDNERYLQYEEVFSADHAENTCPGPFDAYQPNASSPCPVCERETHEIGKCSPRCARCIDDWANEQGLNIRWPEDREMFP